VVTFRGCEQLTSLEGLGAAPALRTLDVSDCPLLDASPLLNGSLRCLRSVDLCGCLWETIAELELALPCVELISAYGDSGSDVWSD